MLSVVRLLKNEKASCQSSVAKQHKIRRFLSPFDKLMTG